MICLALLLLFPLFLLPLAIAGSCVEPGCVPHTHARIQPYALCVHPDGRPVPPAQPAAKR
jgi:hypothetical protein